MFKIHHEGSERVIFDTLQVLVVTISDNIFQKEGQHKIPQ